MKREIARNRICNARSGIKCRATYVWSLAAGRLLAYSMVKFDFVFDFLDVFSLKYVLTALLLMYLVEVSIDGLI